MTRYSLIVALDLVASFGIAILGAINGFEQIASGQFWQGLVTLQAMAAWLYGIDRLSKWAKAKAGAQVQDGQQPSKVGNVAKAVVRTAGKVARKTARGIDRVSDLLDRLAPQSKPAKVTLPAAWLERSTVTNGQPTPADPSPPSTLLPIAAPEMALEGTPAAQEADGPTLAPEVTPATVPESATATRKARSRRKATAGKPAPARMAAKSGRKNSGKNSGKKRATK